MNLLEDLARRQIEPNQAIESLVDYVRSECRNFLFENKSHGFLKDDLIGEGNLALVRACRRIYEQGDLKIAHAGYLKTCIWNAFQDCIRNEQPIRPPKFDDVLSTPDDMLSRETLHDEIEHPFDPFADVDLVDTIEALDLADFQTEVLRLKISGETIEMIAEILDVTKYSVNQALRIIRKRLDDVNS